MTDERKKYLASISKEERVIRDTITALECGISIDKQSITFNINKLGHKKSIEKLKTILKALKKQLPAPMKEQMYYCVKVVNCPICDSALDTWAENYCWKCGQKLR